MHRVCGMCQLDVQCAACSLRLCKRLASRLAHSAAMGHNKHAIAEMVAPVPWSAQKTRSRLEIPSVLRTLDKSRTRADVCGL